MSITRRRFLALAPGVVSVPFLGGCTTIPTPRLEELGRSLLALGQSDPKVIFDLVDAGQPVLDTAERTNQHQRIYKDLKAGMENYRRRSLGAHIYSYDDLTNEVTHHLVRMVRHTAETEAAIRDIANKKAFIINQDMTFVIPPGGMLTYTQKGFCMDPLKPAPVKGDALRLLPAEERIGKNLMPLYRALGEWAARSDYNKSQAQRLTWVLMSVGHEGVSSLDKMPDQDRQLWDEIMPGGANLLIREHKARVLEKKLRREVVKAIGLDKILPSDFLNRILVPAQTSIHLDELIRRGEKMTEGRGIGYSIIGPGVYSRATGSSALVGTFQIVNAGTQPFVFDPKNYMAKPIANKQYISGTSIITNISTTHTTAPDSNAVENQASLTVTAMEELSKFLLEKTWEKAWRSLYHKTPAAVRMANRLMGVGMDVGKSLGVAAMAMPVIGNAFSLYEAITGKDVLTGEALGGLERGYAILGTIPGLQTLRAAAMAVPNVSRFIKAGEPLFRLMDDPNIKISIDLAEFTSGDIGEELGLPHAQFNKQTKKIMKQWALEVKLPWNEPTREFIKAVEQGTISWCNY